MEENKEEKIILTGAENYNTREEEDYQIEFRFKYVKEAFQDPNIDKTTFLSQYILDDTEYLHKWLKDNDKEFTYKSLAK